MIASLLESMRKTLHLARQYLPAILCSIGVVSLVLGLGSLLYSSLENPNEKKIVFEESLSEDKTSLATPSADLQVYLSGSVAQPGVYLVSDGARVRDVVEKAGGFQKDANTERIAHELNLAERVHDEDHIHIPSKQEIRTTEASNQGVVKTEEGKLDINTATQKQLLDLPGVGEVTAQKILDGRPYRSFQDFSTRSGISSKVLQDIQGNITFSTQL